MNGGLEPRGRGPLWESAVLLLLVAIVLVGGGELVRASYHGYLHTGVGEAVFSHGLLPENPYHAGSALRYYTLYPLLGVLLGSIGVGAIWGFAILNLLAAALLAPALDALGRALGLGWHARRCSFWALLLGFNGLGWFGVFFPATEIGLIQSDSPVMTLAATTFSGHYFHWDQRLQAFLPKFLNVSSFALALPFGLWALAATCNQARARPWLGAIVPAALALALNPLVGAFTGLCMIIWLAPRLLSTPGAPAFWWVCSGLMSVGLAIPFLLPAFASTATTVPQVQVQLGGNPVGDLLGPLLLMLPLGCWGLTMIEKRVRLGLIAALGLAAALLVFGSFPWGNEYKFARLGGVLLALPTGVALARIWDWRPTVVVLLGLVCLPTTGMVLNAYLNWGRGEVEAPLTAISGRLQPGDAFKDLRPLVAELRAGDAQAVLLADPTLFANNARAVVQGNPLAALVPQSLVVDLLHVHNEGQPDLHGRLQAMGVLMQADLEGRQEALGVFRHNFANRSIYLVIRPVEGLRDMLLDQGGSELVGGTVSLWHFQPVGGS